MGFVLLNFDIDKDGNTKNIEVLDGKCGNMYSPFTTFDRCNSFNSSAKQYMKKVTYNPTTFEGKEIYSMNNKHSISFFLDGEEPLNIMNLSDYRKLIDHINNERLINYCKEFDKKISNDTYIFGHSHYISEEKINNNAFYYNAGDWITNSSYLVLSNNKFKINKY